MFITFSTYDPSVAFKTKYATPTLSVIAVILFPLSVTQSPVSSHVRFLFVAFAGYTVGLIVALSPPISIMLVELTLI